MICGKRRRFLHISYIFQSWQNNKRNLKNRLLNISNVSTLVHRYSEYYAKQISNLR